MDLSSSDEDDYQVEFWNNWLPTSSQKSGEVKYLPRENKGTKTKETLFNSSKVSLIHSEVENSKFGNWIPPTNFLHITPKYTPDPKTIDKQFQKGEEASTGKNNNITEGRSCQNKERTGEVTENLGKGSISIAAYRKYMNLDWGQRRQLHNVTYFINDGDLVWGVVHLGVFSNIKLWVNEYNNICCLACGKISKVGSSGTTFISITNTELLRKVLNIPSSQWSSLCETVKETKIALNFDAFKDYELSKRTPIERLWLFICKRRHFLPGQSMLLKFSGAVKCMEKLEITPRLLVQDIRNIPEAYTWYNKGQKLY